MTAEPRRPQSPIHRKARPGRVGQAGHRGPDRHSAGRPRRPARSPFGLDLGPACQQCGGMMQRTGACYTCSSCGFNTGCG